MKRVLIVEDNEKAVLLLQKILGDINKTIEVKVANNINSAKQMLVKKDFDLFIVDIIMDPSNPFDASGLNFIEFLRGFKQYEYVPVVITTSVAEMKEHAYDILDCYKYLEKPYDYDYAKSVLEKAINVPLDYDTTQFVHIKCDGIVHAIKWTDIVGVFYTDRRITIQLVRGTMNAYYRSLAEIYSMLPSRKFIKCNNHAVINKNFVTAVDKQQNKVILKKPFGSVKIGISFRKRILEELLGE